MSLSSSVSSSRISINHADNTCWYFWFTFSLDCWYCRLLVSRCRMNFCQFSLFTVWFLMLFISTNYLRIVGIKLIPLPPGGEQSIVVSVSVCVWGFLTHHTAKLESPTFCVHCLWPWLGPLPALPNDKDQASSWVAHWGQILLSMIALFYIVLYC